MSEIREYLDSVTNGEFSPRQKELLTQIMTDFVRHHYEPTWTEYQIAARRLLSVLCLIDFRMAETLNPAREWAEIAYVFELPSRLTQAQIGRRFGLTTMAVSKATSKLRENILATLR